MKKTTQEKNENDDDALVNTSRSRDGLLCTLLTLKVCLPPSTSSLFVLRKKLVRSYLNKNQNYLGITQAEYDGGFRRQGQGVLTDEEHGRVHTTAGLPLRALDRRGVSYPMVLIHLAKTWRLRKGWGEFLRRSGVRQDEDTHVDDVVEIWAFRSPAWPSGLGLVLLHYTKKEDAIITASLLQQEQEEEEDGSVTTTASLDDSSSGGSDQEADEPLDKQVGSAATILISMTK